MNRLLSAGFAHMKKDKVFWICAGFLFALGGVTAFMNYQDQLKYGVQVPLDGIFFYFTVFNGILSAVFCSLFIGTEYSDGTIRNKLVVGHSRNAIYLSNFILSAASGLLMNLAFIIAVSAAGIPLLGFFQTDICIVMLFLLGSIMMSLAFSSIFTTLSMLNQNKAVVAVICIVGVVVLFIAAMYIQNRLRAPEFYEGYTFIDLQGNSSSEPVANPRYLRGTARAVYQFFLDFLPTGQAIQFVDMSGRHLWLMPLYSMLITVVTTVGGLFFFRKKDLK